jgi:hypothetical protein
MNKIEQGNNDVCQLKPQKFFKVKKKFMQPLNVLIFIDPVL